MRLSADGARLLRAVRDYIAANPTEFDMGEWECGTYACIGGHLCRLAGIQFGSSKQEEALWACMGFPGDDTAMGHPLGPLFYEFDEERTRDVSLAAARINQFLWQYGYPPNALEPADVAATVPESVVNAEGLAPTAAGAIR